VLLQVNGLSWLLCVREVAAFPRCPHRIGGVSHKPSTGLYTGLASGEPRGRGPGAGGRGAPPAGSPAPSGNGLTAGDAPDDTGLGVSLGWGDDELGTGRVGDGFAERLAGADGDGVGDRVTRGAESVGVGVGLGPDWAGPAGGGHTQMYKANTATNSPMSTNVEVRGCLLTRRLRSRGRCRGRPRR
jgi:hypothetical protein